MTKNNIKALIGLGAAGVMLIAPLIFNDNSSKKEQTQLSGGSSVPIGLPSSGTERATGTTVNVEAPEKTGTNFFRQAQEQPPNNNEGSESLTSGSSSSFTLSDRQKKSLENKNIDSDSYTENARKTQSTPDPFIRDAQGKPIGSRDISNKDAPTMTEKPTQNMTPVPDKKKSERQTQKTEDEGFFDDAINTGKTLLGGLY